MTAKDDHDHDHSCFWMGGFIGHSVTFMLGMFLTLLLISAATKNVFDTGARVGACRTACAARGFDLYSAPSDAGCECFRTGAPNTRVTVDPKTAVNRPK